MSGRPSRQGSGMDPDALPHEHRAEENVLAGLLTYGPDAAANALPRLSPALFADGAHRAIFEAMGGLHAARGPCAVGDVANALRKAKMPEVSALAMELGTRPGALPPVTHGFGSEVDKLVDAHAKRLLFGLGSHLRGASLNGLSAAELLAETRASLEHIAGEGAATGAECTSLGDLRAPTLNDGAELLRHRFLCRGGGLLLVGPTGIGKSSFTMQALVLWALGRPCFGIVPARPLRALLIQAENDDGDLAEMRDGVIRGLNLSRADQERAGAAIMVRQEDARTGREFFARTVEPLLVEHRPDLLVIDPALAFLGGESNSQADVGGFLRNGLNPLLHRYGCAGIVVHHTNKPPTGQEKGEWAGGDFAYLGGGSAEWANWPRAVIAIRSKGSHEVFELVLAKRGARVGWTDPGTGGKAFTRLIGHATEPGAICWREVDPSETELAGRNGKRIPQPNDLMSFIPELDPVEIDALLGQVQAAGTMGKHKARDFLAVLKGDGRVFEWRMARPGVRPVVAYARRRQPAFDQLSRAGTTPRNNGNSGGKRVIPSTPIPPVGGVCGNNATPRRNNPDREEAPGEGAESEVGK